MQPAPNHSASMLTLEQVKDHFSHWRQTKIKGGKIPKHLWQEVFSLSGRYRHSKILSTLGLSTAQYRQMKAKLIGTDDKSPNTDFVEITPMVNNAKSLSQRQPLVTQSQSLIIDYQRSDGALLSVKGLSLGDVHQLVADFYGRS